MSNKNKIYKLISVALVAPMVLGISNQTFENLKVFASSGEQGKAEIGFGINRSDEYQEHLGNYLSDSDYSSDDDFMIENDVMVELEDGTNPEVYIDDIYYGLCYDTRGRIFAKVFGSGSDIRNVTIHSVINYNGNAYIVKKIGYCAFQDQTQLESITLPDTIEEIWSDAFANCTSLRSIVLPSSTKCIWSDAFANCSSLETVKFKGLENNLRCNYDIFENCDNLTTIKVPAGCRDQFVGCFGNVDLPNGCQIVEE